MAQNNGNGTNNDIDVALNGPLTNTLDQHSQSHNSNNRNSVTDSGVNGNSGNSVQFGDNSSNRPNIQQQQQHMGNGFAHNIGAPMYAAPVGYGNGYHHGPMVAAPAHVLAAPAAAQAIHMHAPPQGIGQIFGFNGNGLLNRAAVGAVGAMGPVGAAVPAQPHHGWPVYGQRPHEMQKKQLSEIHGINGICTMDVNGKHNVDVNKQVVHKPDKHNHECNVMNDAMVECKDSNDKDFNKVSQNKSTNQGGMDIDMSSMCNNKPMQFGKWGKKKNRKNMKQNDEIDDATKAFLND